MTVELETRLRYLNIEMPGDLVARALAAPSQPKRRRPTALIAAAAILALAGASAAAAFQLREDRPFIPWRESERGPHVELTWVGPFDEEEALELGQQLAAAYLEDTVATKYSIDGRPVELSDLELVSQNFLPGRPCSNPTPGFSCDGMNDRWQLRWERRGYLIEEWDKIGTIYVEVEFDNATGVTKGAGAGVVADQ
jgi:hypothetical protein